MNLHNLWVFAFHNIPFSCFSFRFCISLLCFPLLFSIPISSYLFWWQITICNPVSFLLFGLVFPFLNSLSGFWSSCSPFGFCISVSCFTIPVLVLHPGFVLSFSDLCLPYWFQIQFLYFPFRFCIPVSWFLFMFRIPDSCFSFRV